ncbi:MAG: helix-turn-helix domain-containing protein [Synergistaceae bacterium]|nr:helix-turn-helix domain-containing protein [Synergistaceae bacterium]
MLIETDNYIDAVTASRILGITRARISTLCKEGRFAGMVKIGHFWLIPRESVEGYTRLKPGKRKGSMSNDEQ